MMTIIAILPAAFLMYYIYKMDKVEKEPWPLLFRIFLCGMLTIIPVSVFGTILEVILLFCVEEENELYNFIYMFIVVALVEEYWKRWAAKRAWKHQAFNYRFDALVYCVTAALGFAALENVLYVAEGGISVALLRAVTSVPSHAVDGVVMGIFFGEAKLRERLGDKAGKRRYWCLSLILPTMTHGIYDYCLVSEWPLALLFFMVFMILIDIWAIRYLKQASALDEPL